MKILFPEYSAKEMQTYINLERDNMEALSNSRQYKRERAMLILVRWLYKMVWVILILLLIGISYFLIYPLFLQYCISQRQLGGNWLYWTIAPMFGLLMVILCPVVIVAFIKPDKEPAFTKLHRYSMEYKRMLEKECTLIRYEMLLSDIEKLQLLPESTLSNAEFYTIDNILLVKVNASGYMKEIKIILRDCLVEEVCKDYLVDFTCIDTKIEEMLAEFYIITTNEVVDDRN